MKLITKEIERKIPALYSTEGSDNQRGVVKFFTPWAGWTWYVIEGERQEDGDWLFFGLVEGLETEYGYFLLSELAGLRGPGGLKVERDRYYRGEIPKA